MSFNDENFLRRQSFDVELINEVQKFYDEDCYCDCTLVADNISRDCHRLIVSTYSPFLHNLLMCHTSDRPVLTLDGVTKEELNGLLEYMYTGSTCIPVHQLPSFLKTCHSLDIRGLKDLTLEEQIPAEEVIEEVNAYITDTTESYFEEEIKPTPIWEVDSNDHSDHGSNTYLVETSDAEELMAYVDSPQPISIPAPPHIVVKEPISGRIVRQPRAKRYFHCTQCNNKYSHKRTLLHHLHWVCNQPASYKCHLCLYTGKRKFQLKSHLKHFHKLSMES